ncbi:thioredoxin-like protein (TLP1) [Plasmodium ovale curtisi]|uniref:Thioredoxin-like protein (TLP1) n=1 Tax=Plasmodium ovale curtisi TaxID=864141 RepID=A0A1A8W0P6_PLAOA|nr:thioredoxin-like protein (TLP1) [Plasmodium ovale curtisi]SBS96877.1 thioredoxin-like protein (TLP1) [Plasmodium ovale curtisi]
MKRVEDKLYQEIKNEEEYKKLFAEKNDILYIIDVYTEWCGPCLITFEMINKIYKIEAIETEDFLITQFPSLRKWCGKDESDALLSEPRRLGNIRGMCELSKKGSILLNENYN